MTASSAPALVSDRLRPLVAGRTVVLVTTDLAAGESILRHLREVGASRILVLGPATARFPTAAADAELVEVDLEDDDPAVTQQRWEALLADPPSGLQNLLDARDPDRSAVILVPPWFTTVELLGRPVLGADHPGRDPHEHTLLADRLWEDAGMPASRP